MPIQENQQKPDIVSKPGAFPNSGQPGKSSDFSFTYGAIGKEPGNMQTDFLVATFFNLGMNLIYTVVALIIALAALRTFDKKFLKSIDIEQELKNNNMAVAVFASTILIFVALIVTFGFRA